MRRLIPTLLLLIVFSAAALADESAAAPAATSVSSNDHGDAVLKAMLAELKRSQEKLQLGQMQRPYYIDYQVTEIQDNIADATLGALRTDQVNSGRLVRVVVRIGDYKQDSYFGEGMGAVFIPRRSVMGRQRKNASRIWRTAERRLAIPAVEQV